MIIKKRLKKINVNKIKTDKNKSLFNKKKFAEYIKDKITNKKSNRSSLIQEKNTKILYLPNSINIYKLLLFFFIYTIKATI